MPEFYIPPVEISCQFVLKLLFAMDLFFISQTVYHAISCPHRHRKQMCVCPETDLINVWECYLSAARFLF